MQRRYIEVSAFHEIPIRPRPVEALIEEGKYDSVAKNLLNQASRNAPTGAVYVASLGFIHVGRKIDTQEAERLLSGAGMVAAKTPEALAFSAWFRDIQRLFPVIALGAADDGWWTDRLALHLGGSVVQRSLGYCRLNPYLGDDKNTPWWAPECRFLGVVLPPV